jgi:hypothetical protein
LSKKNGPGGKPGPFFSSFRGDGTRICAAIHPSRSPAAPSGERL